jgi:hypothetical protein
MIILGTEGAVGTFGQALDTTTNATVYSKRFGSRQAYIYSLHIEYAGGSSLTSEATLWASNKSDPDASDDDDWVDTGVAFTDITTGTAATELKNLVDYGYRWLRLKVETTNGTGKVSVWVEAKLAAL